MGAMFAEEDGSVIGYMDKTDWECEIGMASGGVGIYPSVEDLISRANCWKSCGVVKVKVSFVSVEIEPMEIDE